MSERAKRASRSNNNKQQAALERLQNIRSGKERAIDGDKDVEDVFDYVDDEEYSEVVKKRIDADWIVDDSGAAEYYEDGREVYEEDEDDDIYGGNKYEREYENYGKDGKKVPLRRKNESNSKSSKKIGNMKSYLISNQKNVQKKTFDQMHVEDDDLLKGILDDINTTSNSTTTINNSKHNNFGSSFNNNGRHHHNKINKNNNKRKLDDFDSDDDLMPAESSFSTTGNGAGGSTNNPFSVSTESNFKKIRTCSFDIDDDSLDISELPDSTLLTDNATTSTTTTTADKQKQQSISTSLNEPVVVHDSDLNFEVAYQNNKMLNESSYQIADDENLIFEEDDEKYLRMYWIDLYEDFKQPGTVYMFGKVYVQKANKYLSCCIICKNVEHKILIYPRTHMKSDPDTLVSMEDVREEIKTVLGRLKVKSFRTKTVTKNYAFEKDIVTSSEYLELLYQPTPNNSILPSDLSGETFASVFGYNQSSLERFILDLKLKGPCWLKFRKPEISSPQISWCKFEFSIEKPFSYIKIDTNQADEVPYTFMTLSLKTYLNPKTKQNELIAISCLTNSEYYISKNNDKSVPKVDGHFCLITKPSASSNLSFPFDFKDTINNRYKKTKVHVANSERELINLFMAKLTQIDPDILIGHDIQSFDIGTLLSRLATFKMTNWSKLGRLRRSRNVPLLARERNSVTVGRLLCDTQIAAKELIRAKSYDLNELARQILKKERKEVCQTELSNYYKSTTDLIRFIDLSMVDSSLINDLLIELNVLPLYAEITKIAGNIFSRTLLGGRSERNEYLLLHAFNEKNHILPDKTFKPSKFSKLNEDDNNQVAEVEVNVGAKRKKAAYTGGLVLDPKVGFYDKYILLMDFNSLYPSIIQEYNICFTTVDRKSFLESVVDTVGEKLPELMNSEDSAATAAATQLSPGILPTEICKLVDSRRKVKKMILDPKTTPEEKQQLDIKQKALKLTANSMYGCLGFSNSRFYARPLAALITAKGREILSNTKQLTESLGLEVIYGDTDSLMINTNSTNFDEARSIGYKLEAEINKRYKLLEIGIDGIFRSILLLKKKKYAAVIATKENNQIKFTREVKGLDIIRRDWSVIAKKVGEKVLDEILSFNQTSEQIIENIHNYLSQIATEINEKRLTNNNYLIIKQLTKNPEEYTDKKSLSHVLVAMRLNESKKRTRPFKAGDTIPYVICISKENKNNFNSLPSTQRAYHLEELKENNDLEIDSKYYLQQQIHPIVSRLCDPIEGTDSHVIAEFLGIESAISISNQKGADLDYELLTKSNETRFDTCRPLEFTCPNQACKRKIIIRDLIEKVNANEVSQQQQPDQQSQQQKSKNYKLSFDKCPDCQERFADEKYRNYFVNRLKVYLRSFITEYYKTWSTCEDPICKHRTRKLNGVMAKKGQICDECNEGILYPDITDAQIYLQFTFFTHILDTDRAVKELPKFDNDEQRKEYIIRLECLSAFYKRLYDVVQQFKKQMAYDTVDLTFLFSKQVFSFVKLD